MPAPVSPVVDVVPVVSVVPVVPVVPVVLVVPTVGVVAGADDGESDGPMSTHANAMMTTATTPSMIHMLR